MYLVEKTYGQNEGLSCVFRQWRATFSHCRFLHGYALGVRLTFTANTLDARNWVIDFGGFKAIRDYLHNKFDHKCLVAEDDPQRKLLELMATANIMEVHIVPGTGCELFASMIYDYVNKWLIDNTDSKKRHESGLRLHSVQVWEHEGNSATYRPVQVFPPVAAYQIPNNPKD